MERIRDIKLNFMPLICENNRLLSTCVITRLLNLVRFFHWVAQICYYINLRTPDYGLWLE
jgi:hypothetical protein